MSYKTICKSQSGDSLTFHRSLTSARMCGLQSGSIDEVQTESDTDVVIQGTIPDVFCWAREKIDAEPESLEGKESLSGARSLARHVLGKQNVVIAMNEIDYWKAESRLWENIYAFAVKLPGDGKENNILDAMSRYPSSILVYRGVKYFFGRKMVIAGRKTPRFSLTKNALAIFSPSGSEESLSKKWFESNTLSRMQKMVVHMCAVSEYVLRCAYMSKRYRKFGEHQEYEFHALLECRLRTERDFKNREMLRFDPWDSLSELSPQDIFPCL